ncbi:hypothetical protein NX722_13515 [Endozoicomonas gorgoniicola]|uniref:Uncharacterized protein n=1 Tax=Endozoicomonas gorgoniicola TaxID=1234144 RepID=A0ABT3MW65_9GAMM|nr:hypothetical protein [Endozoicomonas gorgoniicola]MCW7553626.1 hypothetical protein [Endozoicomonas gorgoniicola]
MTEATPSFDFEIERLDISAAEAGVFGKLVTNIRQQHLNLCGTLTDDEARMMLKLLNEINNSIYHVGQPGLDEKPDEVNHD